LTTKITLNHNGFILIQRKIKYAWVSFDLCPSKFNLTEEAQKQVQGLFCQHAKKGTFAFISITGGSFKIPVEFLDYVTSELKRMLEEPKNLVRIAGSIE
jgi:hypothetical protein